jgi:hypothetical protein
MVCAAIMRHNPPVNESRAEPVRLLSMGNDRKCKAPSMSSEYD